MAVEKLTFEMNAVGNAVPEMKKVQTQLGNVSKSMAVASNINENPCGSRKDGGTSHKVT